MVTSINLRTSSNLFYKKSDYPLGGVQYDLYEKVTQGSLSCDVSGEVIDTVKAIVNFYIQGPSFDTARKLDAGTHWNGVTISQDYSQIIIREEIITGLEPGVYTITYYSSKNPAQSNKLIFIVMQSQKPVQVINSVISAALFADNGYGRADRAEIYFKDTLKKLPDSIIIAWPSLTDRKVFTGSSIVSYNDNKKHLTVKAAQTFRPEVTTYGGTDNLGICYALDTSFSNPLSIIPFKIADSIGPLIASASFSERTVAGPDTFILQFSENIIDTSCLGKSLLLIIQDRQCTLTVIDIASIGSSFRVLTKALDGISIAEGDSLRLYPDGPVLDSYGNHPHLKNRPVALTIRKKPPEITNAFYRDVNADGIIDEVTVFFDKDIVIDGVKGVVAFRSLTSSSISEDRIAHTSGQSVLTFDIRNVYKESVDGFTSGTMNIAVTFSDFPGYTATHAVSDSAAPVILDAYFSESVRSASGDTSPDTLVITFSEEITDSSSGQLFTFKAPRDVDNRYTLFVRVSGKNNVRYHYHVYNLEGDGYPQDNDSVFITPSGNISDVNGNIQNDYNNRRALLKTRPVSLNLNVTFGPSPFNPAKERLIITADPETKTKSAIKIRIEITIYDCLGNLLFRNSQESNGLIKCSWDGTNKNGRRVGNGTYLLLAKATDLKSSQSILYQRKIGVAAK
jgi:hypothetical protein